MSFEDAQSAREFLAKLEAAGLKPHLFVRNGFWIFSVQAGGARLLWRSEHLADVLALAAQYLDSQE